MAIVKSMQKGVRVAPSHSSACGSCGSRVCKCLRKQRALHVSRSRTIVMNATRRSSGTRKTGDEQAEDGDVGTAEAPAIPGFGREDTSIALKSRDNAKYLSTQDVMTGPFKKKGVEDASGAIGKGLGVYKYADKYKGNIDTFAPIYNPEAFGDDAITAMSDIDFVKFMIPFTALFVSIPGFIFAKGVGFI